MPRKPEPLEPWMLEAINLIVTRIVTLRQAAQQLGVLITPQQADNIWGRRRFQDALEDARLKYYTEVGRNPRLTKDAVMGQLFVLAQRLTEDHEDAKAKRVAPSIKSRIASRTAALSSTTRIHRVRGGGMVGDTTGLFSSRQYGIFAGVIAFLAPVNSVN